MGVIYLNASMDINERNVFDFIDSKLVFGVEESDYYLTPIGSYIVNGSPFRDSFSEWVNEYGIFDYEFDSFEECPESIKAKLQEDYSKFISSWLDNNNLSSEDLKELDLLRLQYRAIVDLSHEKNVEDSKRTIAETKKATGKNVLEYLVSLKPVTSRKSRPISETDYYNYPWTSLRDRQGSQLCAVLTGIDPCPNDSRQNDGFIMQDLDSSRSEFLSRMHADFERYENIIDEITLDQVNSNASTQGIVRR